MKKLLTTILIFGIATATNAQLPVWVAGIIAGMGSIVAAVGIAITVSGDYEGYVINTVPVYYNNEMNVSYSPGRWYRQKWTVQQAMGTTSYTRSFVSDSGSSVSNEPFSFGDTGLPLAKVKWECSSASYSATQSSTVEFSSSYSITKPAMYSWNVPMGAYITIRMAGTVLGSHCGVGYGEPGVTTAGKYVPRSGVIRWKLEKENLSINDWMAITQ